MATPLFCKNSALSALASDRTPENQLFFDILENKLFSRFGSLTEATRKATQDEFAKRNVAAALWELGRTYVGKIPLAILNEDVRAVQLHLWRFAESAYAHDTHQSVIGGMVKHGVQPWECASAMEPGPGSTVSTMGQPGATCITKFLYGDQGVGSTAIYARYIHLLASCDTKTQSYTDIERIRVRQCGTAVTPQELIVIPKNERTGRVITPQNGIDLLVQKELAYRMTVALRETLGVDLSTQPGRNSELAKRGSIDGSVATLDLQAASDSITVNTVKLLFKGHPLLGQLMGTRNPYILIEGKRVTMHIFGGMGCDTTFPLQTAIFTSIARVASKRCGRRGGVSFGDDIIVHDSAAEYCVELLSYLGFKVNLDKSFWTARVGSPPAFRESCGGYFQNGLDIAPFRIDEVPEQGNAFKAFNLAVDCMARTGISLVHLIRYLEQFLPAYTFVPPWFCVTSGIRAPRSYVSPQIRIDRDMTEFIDVDILTDTLQVSDRCDVATEVADMLAPIAFWHGCVFATAKVRAVVFRRADLEFQNYTNLYPVTFTGVSSDRDGNTWIEFLRFTKGTSTWKRVRISSWEDYSYDDVFIRGRSKKNYKNTPSANPCAIGIALAKL